MFHLVISFFYSWVCNEKRLHFRFSLYVRYSSKVINQIMNVTLCIFPLRVRNLKWRKEKFGNILPLFTQNINVNCQIREIVAKKKFDWPKISKTSQIALGEKIFRKKNSRNYPRFHAGHVRKKLWSHFM